MRAWARCVTLMAGLALCGMWASAYGQSSPTKAAQTGHFEPATTSEGKAEGVSPVWAWVNFAILAGVLGYLIAKYGGPWFASQSLAIRRGIADAEEIRAKAKAVVATVESKLARLEAEILALKTEARREQEAEGERMRQQTAAELARLKEHAASEIVAAGKAARLELKRYGAQLAIELAEQKIARQMTLQVQTALVDSFVRDLGPAASGPHSKK